ncbi:MAG: fimbrillin family protein, partial [Rikenellaceae bacterium]
MRQIFVITLIAILCSCSHLDEESEISPTPSESITFGVDATHSQTRGEMITSISQMTTIGVYAANTHSVGWSSGTSFSKLENQELSYDKDNDEWEYVGQVATWDVDVDNDKYTFYGYSPYESSDNGLTTSILEGQLVVKYEMPQRCENQPDLMLATPRRDIKAPIDGCVDLDLNHALAAIGFSVVGKSTQRIRDIALRGIIASAEVTIDDSGVVEWINFADRTDTEYSADIERRVYPDLYTPTELTLDDGYLMVIPQSLEDVEVVVTIIDTEGEGRVDKSFTFSSDDEWIAGECYLYTINLSSYDYTIEGSSNCYMLHPNGETQTFYIPVEGRINTFWRDYADDNQTYEDRLSSADVWSPVVLWCDVESGFGDFSVRRVVSGFTPSEVVTAESAPDFTTIGTRSAMEVVLPAELTEGNIYIGVEFEGEILWSWHLWVTDYDPDKIARSVSPQSSRLTYSLSDVEGELHRYEDNHLWGSGGIYEDKFIMDRNVGALSTRYASDQRGVLHYQFGRKDPFPIASLPKGEVTVNDDNIRVSFITAVNNPTTFYLQGNYPYSWSLEGVSYAENYLWDDKSVVNESNPTSYEKSIFDPSPLGWKLPIYGTYVVLTDQNCTQSSSKELLYNGEIYFPFTGYRSNLRGTVNDYGSQGNLRLATPIDGSHSYNLAYSSTITETNNTRADGFSVRAIQE